MRSSLKVALGSSRFAALVAFTLALVMTVSASAQTPPPEALAIRVTPDERAAHRGEVLSFMVEIVNTSTVDILRTGTSGGAALQMRLPKGFGFVAGSGLIDLSSGQSVPALDPARSRSEPRLVQDRDGQPQTLNIGAGQALRFRYQIRALPTAEVDTESNHAAWLVTSDGTRISSDAVARLRIEADPELDLAVVMGTVYCDNDSDGKRDEGERGIGGVRIAGDHGRVVDSDRDGRFHLRDFKPGAHLVKLDVNTLPPGAKLTTPVSKLLDLTGGLLVEHSFGARCSENMQQPSELILAGADGPAPPIDANSLTLRGNTKDLTVAWEGFVANARRATLTVEADQMTAQGKRARVQALNLPWRPGQLPKSLTFYPKLEGAVASAKAINWTIEVTHVDGATRELVRAFSGRGLPPERMSWEGLDPEGAVGVLRRGALHEVRLVITDGYGERLESAPVVIGTSWSPEGAVKEVSRTIARDNLLTKVEEPTPKLMALLKRAKQTLDKTPGARLLIEVHTDPSGGDEVDLTRTRRAAFNLGVYARKTLGLTSDKFFAMGFGNTRPLRPNVTARNRAFNKRIELVILPPEDERKLPVPPLPKFAAQAFVQGQPVPIDDGGSFLATVARVPGSTDVAVSLQGGDGARRTVVQGMIEGPKKTPGVDEGGALIIDPGVKPKRDPKAALPELDAPSLDGKNDGKDKKDPITGLPTPEGVKPEGLLDKAPTPTQVGPSHDDLAKDPLRRFGGKSLRDVLGPGALVVGDDSGPNKVTADDLQIDLPPKDAMLASPRLFVSGRTNPANTITINDQPLRVDTKGRFGGLVILESDTKNLSIVSTDKAGNVARLDWPVKVKDTEIFLLALVDGVGGQLGARLGERDVYEQTANDSLFVAGRGALYVKGRVSGGALVKDLFVTAHLDSARKNGFSPFFDQVIDPTRDYLIYGDASDDVRDANARGQFYLMVEADKSKLMYGSFRTDVSGIHLLRYDRTFDGAKLDIDHELADGFRTRLKAYVSDDNRRLVRRHDELRATGGSVYYMSSKEIIEGSEKLEIVVREQDTQLELGRATLTRDVHYRVDYASGRIMTMGPISAVIDPFFQLAGFQPFTGRAVLDGHEVWLDVDYEARAVRPAGDIAWGVQAKQELFGVVEIGAGIVREGRPAGASGSDQDYVLWGLHAKVALSEKSHLYAEYANGTDKDGGTRVSLDGGIAFRDLDRSPKDRGDAFLVGLDADVGELFDVKDLDLQVKLHWQMVSAGFHATGLAAEEATEKWGGEATWAPNEDGRIHLRYDGGTTLVADDTFLTGMRAVVRNRMLGRYDHRISGGTVYGELAYGQHRDDLDGQVTDTTALALGTIYRITPRLRFIASQEVLVGGDDTVLGADTSDRLTTNVGLEYQLSDDLAIRLGESLRWNGDNATRFGFTTRLGDDSRAYFEERIQPGDRNGRVVGATVVGAEHALGRGLQDGRIYSEYRLDGGVGGRTNRAVMGLGRSFELHPGVKLMLAYERSQVVDAPEFDPSRGTRDVLSGGLYFAAVDWLRFGSVYEVRWDRDLPTGAFREVLQALTRNTVDMKIDNVTIFGLFNYVLSQDLETRRVAREDMEASFGLAYRPLDNDDLILIARYTRAVDRRSDTVVSLLGEALVLDERRISDLISVGAIIELPLGLTLTEKLVYRMSGIDTTGSVLGEDDLLLWLNRLSVDIYGGLSFAGEFRLFASLADMEVRKNGGLIEVAYEILEHGRVGLGWSIDGSAGGLLPGQEENDIDNGFFVRLTGMY